MTSSGAQTASSRGLDHTQRQSISQGAQHPMNQERLDDSSRFTTHSDYIHKKSGQGLP